MSTTTNIQPATILFDKHEGVATITLNRPAARNALNNAMCDELLAALVDIAADSQCASCSSKPMARCSAPARI